MYWCLRRDRQDIEPMSQEVIGAVALNVHVRLRDEKICVRGRAVGRGVRGEWLRFQWLKRTRGGICPLSLDRRSDFHCQGLVRSRLWVLRRLIEGVGFSGVRIAFDIDVDV